MCSSRSTRASRLPVAWRAGVPTPRRTLVALDTLWGGGLSREALLELAAELGSDVPFALHGGTALGLGRGEQLTSVLARGDYHWVLALADGGLVHAGGLCRARHLARGAPTRPRAVRPTRCSAPCGPATPRPSARRWPTTCRSRRCGCGPPCGVPSTPVASWARSGTVVSGSGPTCAFLVQSSGDALTLAAALSAAGVCRAVRTAHGPVHGARVVAHGVLMANLVNLEQVTKSYGTRTLLDACLPGHRRALADRCRRPQRRRKVHAGKASGASRATRRRSSHSHRRAAGGLAVAERTAARRGDRAVRGGRRPGRARVGRRRRRCAGSSKG